MVCLQVSLKNQTTAVDSESCCLSLTKTKKANLHSSPQILTLASCRSKYCCWFLNHPEPKSTSGLLFVPESELNMAKQRSALMLHKNKLPESCSSSATLTSSTALTFLSVILFCLSHLFFYFLFVMLLYGVLMHSRFHIKHFVLAEWDVNSGLLVSIKFSSKNR